MLNYCSRFLFYKIIRIPIFKNSAKSFSIHSSNYNSLHHNHLIKAKNLFFVCYATMSFQSEKDKFLAMNLQEKRSKYHCGSNFVTLENVPTWKEYASKLKPSDLSPAFPRNEQLNKKVSIFKVDITALEIDGIVNAANKTLRGGGGVDGCIHRAAGKNLLEECITLKGCETGQAKVTGGYKLPAKYVIHTVGPVGEKPDLLRQCYKSSLSLAKETGIRSIAFPCISTGIYGYPNEPAAHVALQTVRNFLDSNADRFDRIIFCLWLPVDVDVYESLMQQYFPM